MFKDLRAGTKFLILCVVCLLLASVATYALLVEKQIAISFARSELVGSRYLSFLRPIYAAVLGAQTNTALGVSQTGSEAQSIDSLLRADIETDGTLHIEPVVKSLAATLHHLDTSNAANIPVDDYLTALKTLREVAARIGDDSKLILDPVLDTYHVGNIVVARLPAALEVLGQAQLSTRAAKAANGPSERTARLIALDTLLRTNLDEIANDLRVAQRGNPDEGLRQLLDPAVTSFSASARSYLDTLRTFVGAGTENATQLDVSYAEAVTGALAAWDLARKQLDQLLKDRIEGLSRQRLISLIVIGALGILALLTALLTYRDMIVPIKRLAELANTIRETKNYGLRFKYESRDEIGGLTAAFNEMLGELSAAREREIMSQTEIARVSRLTTMGAMVASIAHEIRQPLAAVVANSQAGTRWLDRKEPNLEEARAALDSIGDNGHRANEVITSISAMFKKNSDRRVPVDINEVVNDVLNLSRGELRSRKIALHMKLASDLPRVSADPVQLREVLLNLTMNAAEAMNTTAENLRALGIASMLETDTVKITVEDSGVGIDPKNADQIFEAFFTTKTTGMGMGLAICRSIITAHDGRLWATPGNSCGTIFHVALPTGANPGVDRTL
jgi:signal transduction histidine kinase